MNIGCYIRVSTQEQAKEGYSIGAQTQRLQAYCTARGWDIYKIYTDAGFSGAKLDRPALQNLIIDAQQHRIDAVLVYKLDRLSRSQKDTLYLIEDVFIKNDVAFISLNESFDTSTAFGRAVIGMLSVFAQLEREQIKERCQMGLYERVKSGLWHGGGNPPIGYDYVDGKLTVNPYEALQIQKIYHLYVNEGYSLNGIVRYMNNHGFHHKYGEWTEPINIRRVLTNPTYTGVQKWNDEFFQGIHEPLIPCDVYKTSLTQIEQSAAAQESKNTASGYKATQLLTGILFCGNCGARYYGQGVYRGSKKLPYSQRTYTHQYSCYSRTKTKKSMVKDPACKNKNWKTDELDTIIKKEILKLCEDTAFIANVTQLAEEKNSLIQQNEDSISQQIIVVQKRIDKLLSLYLENDLPPQSVRTMLDKLYGEHDTLKKHLTNCSIKPTRSLPQTQSWDFDLVLKDILAHGELELQRRIVQSLIERITVYESKLEILWKF